MGQISRVFAAPVHRLAALVVPQIPVGSCLRFDRRTSGGHAASRVMKQIMENVAFVALASLWLGLFNVMKIVEIKNQKRDLVLDISPDGAKLTAQQRDILFSQDYRPMSQGCWIFLGILALFLVFAAVSAKDPWESVIAAACAGFAVFALVVDVRAYRMEAGLMRNRIAEALVDEEQQKKT